MKVRFSLLLLMFSFVAISFSAFAQGIQQEKNAGDLYQSIAFKPVNYCKIPLGLYTDGILGISIGLEYERQFQNYNNWSWVLPITFTRINNFIFTDYYPNGFQTYFSPGIKYYPKGNVSNKGYHLGLNAMLGYYDFDFSSMISQGNRHTFFSGLLANNHFTITFGKRSGINIEAGLGLIFSKVQGKADYISDFPPYQYSKTINNSYSSLIGNFSIAWIYAFHA